MLMSSEYKPIHSPKFSMNLSTLLLPINNKNGNPAGHPSELIKFTNANSSCLFYLSAKFAMESRPKFEELLG